MTELDPDRIALKFVNEINRHDVAALSSMMAPDFRFVDELGHEVRGRERMTATWTAYFSEFPDYHVVIRDHLALGVTVALFGTASGTQTGPTAGGRYSLPVAWRAVVRDGHVVEWQMYTDPEPLRRPRVPGEPSTTPSAPDREGGRL